MMNANKTEDEYRQNKDTTLLTTDIVYSCSVLHAMNMKQPPPLGSIFEEYTMLEESNAFTMVLLDASSLQTNLYTRLRIGDWQHWVFVIA